MDEWLSAVHIANDNHLCVCQDKDREAELAYERAVVVLEAARGLHHPSIAVVLTNMAGLLMKQVSVPAVDISLISINGDMYVC